MTDFQAWSCSLPSLPYISCPPAGMYSHTVDVLEGRLVVCHSLSCLQLTPQGWQARGDTTMKINPTLILWGNSKGRQFPVGRTKRRRRTEPPAASQHNLIWKWQARGGGGGHSLQQCPNIPLYGSDKLVREAAGCQNPCQSHQWEEAEKPLPPMIGRRMEWRRRRRSHARRSNI